MSLSTKRSEATALHLAGTTQAERGLTRFKTALAKSVATAEAAGRSAGDLVDVPTGSQVLVDLPSEAQEFADLIGGLHDTDALVVATRPTTGSASLAGNLAWLVANRSGAGLTPQAVALFSLEMSAEQLATTILAERTGIQSEKLRRGQLSDEEFGRLVQASQELEAAPLYIDDTPAIPISTLRTRARRLKRQHGLSLIVVDYLQLIRPAPGQRAGKPMQEISEITQGLKAVAKELGVPVLALTELGRAVERRDVTRPVLADQRGSGSIEELDEAAEKAARRNAAFLERAAALPDGELDEAPIGDSVPASETSELLGGAAALGQTVREIGDLARAVHAGLPVAVLDGLRRAGFTGAEIEGLVAPPRTLARRRKEGQLTVEEGAAVERAARMLVLASRVLGSREAALHWLRQPMRTRLRGSAPLAFLHSDIGARVVEEILVQAEYGLTA